ncbi:MAG: ATP-binding cassette domain-containing protein [Bdellovibrionota bacterium]
MSLNLIEFNNISKKYGSCVSLDQVHFSILKNQIHAVIGENGAGKSTLMKVLTGIVTPTSGAMVLRGKAYEPQSAQDSFREKIGFVHQHFQLADELTGWDHLELVARTQNIERKRLLDLVSEKEAKFKWSLPLAKKIKAYSIGEQQRLEILRVLILEPEIIIFDEPTAVLSPDEIEDFLDFMLDLKKQGHTLILISHKLNEIKKVADHVTILCRGQLIASDSGAHFSIEQMAEKMIGRKQQALVQAVVNDAGQAHDLNLLGLNLKNNEILGVAGVDGNGQEDFIFKLRQNIDLLKLKFGDISEDRYRYSIYPKQNLIENFLIRHRETFTRLGLVKKTLVRREVEKIITDWDVRPAVSDMIMGEFSGGNQQKFVIGRELWHKPDVILAAHPSRGVDIGAQEKIHQALLDQKKNHRAVVLLSSDLDEVLKLSDRFVILFKGAIKGPYMKGSLNSSQISQIMNGVDL